MALIDLRRRIFKEKCIVESVLPILCSEGHEVCAGANYCPPFARKSKRPVLIRKLGEETQQRPQQTDQIIIPTSLEREIENFQARNRL